MPLEDPERSHPLAGLSSCADHRVETRDKRLHCVSLGAAIATPGFDDGSLRSLPGLVIVYGGALQVITVKPTTTTQTKP